MARRSSPGCGTAERESTRSSPASFHRFFLFPPGIDNDEASLVEPFSFLRIVEADDGELDQLASASLNPRTVGPISAANEARVLKRLEAACRATAAGFETSVAEDDALLRSGTLSNNARSCVVVRRGEKRIRKWFGEYALSMSQFLRRSPEKFEQIRTRLLGQPE